MQRIPLLVVIRDGTEVDRVVGAVPARELKDVLERHVASRTAGAGS